MPETGRRTRRDRSLIGDLESGGLRSIFVFDIVNHQLKWLEQRERESARAQFRVFPVRIKVGGGGGGRG